MIRTLSRFSSSPHRWTRGTMQVAWKPCHRNFFTKFHQTTPFPHRKHVIVPAGALWFGTTRKSASWKDNFNIDLSDALAEAFEPKKPVFLDMYTETDIADILELLGITSALAKMGYKDLIIVVTPREEGDFVDRLTVTDKSLLSEKDLETVALAKERGKLIKAHHISITDKSFLMDLFMRIRQHFMPHDSFAYQQLNRLEQGDWLHLVKDKGNPTTCTVALANGMLSPSEATTIKAWMDAHGQDLNLIQVDWVALQNPKATFDKDRIQLPGQKHPGLHVARQIHTCFQLLAAKNARDGVMDVPEYFHNAFMYRSAGYHFLNPAFQGWFEAVLQDLDLDIRTKGLGAVAWAWNQGAVKDTKGRTVLWFPQEQVYPTTPKMMKYFGLKNVDSEGKTFSSPSTFMDHDTLQDKSSRYYEIKERYKQLYRGQFNISWDTEAGLGRFGEPETNLVGQEFRAFPPVQPISMA